MPVLTQAEAMAIKEILDNKYKDVISQQISDTTTKLKQIISILITEQYNEIFAYQIKHIMQFAFNETYFSIMHHKIEYQDLPNVLDHQVFRIKYRKYLPSLLDEQKKLFNKKLNNFLLNENVEQELEPFTNNLLKIFTEVFEQDLPKKMTSPVLTCLNDTLKTV